MTNRQQRRGRTRRYGLGWAGFNNIFHNTGNQGNQNIGNLIKRASTRDQSLGLLPRDGESYEFLATDNIAHAAGASSLRVQAISSLDSYVSIGDEETRVFDQMKVKLTVVGRTDGYPQEFHLFLVKGPSTMTVTAGDYNPASGIRTAIEDALSNGSEIKHLETLVCIPFRENGGWFTTESIEIDLTDKLNKFVEESEIAISQGRDQPLYRLLVASNGKAEASSTMYRFVKTAHHLRKRRAIV